MNLPTSAILPTKAAARREPAAQWQRAFTLVEMLVVLAIVLLVAGMVQ